MTGLKIIKATYYVPQIGPDKGTDVTEELSSEILGGRLVYSGRYNDIFPDNFPGIVKKLKIEVEYKGKTYPKFYSENSRINLPYDIEQISETKKDVGDTISMYNVGGDYVSGDKIGRDKNTNPSESYWLKKYWLQLSIAIVAPVIVFVIIEGKFPKVFDNTETSVETIDKSNINSDLRGVLIGYGTIFDLITKIRSLNTELDRQDLVKNNLSKSFVASSTIRQLGKLDDGKIWVTLEGQDSDGSNQYMECHFDKSWENTLRSLFNSENKMITFTGKIAFYKQYWLVAENCEVIKY